MRSVAVVLSILLCAAAASAQVTDFPADAKPMEPEALKERLTGKTFHVAPASGAPWRLQFLGTGYYFVNAGNFSDKGTWRVEASRLCTAPSTRPAACNEMRLAGDALHLKRDSGEVVKFEPR